MKINYVIGDATDPQGEGVKLIVHGCNDLGKWGRGFVLALSQKWKGPEKEYKKWIEEFKPELGNFLLVKVEEDIWVCNLISQEGIYPLKAAKGHSGLPPIRYEALKKGFSGLRSFLSEKGKGSNYSIHMPLIGAGLAGGNWDQIEEIIQEELTNHEIDVTVYILPKEKEKWKHLLSK